MGCHLQTGFTPSPHFAFRAPKKPAQDPLTVDDTVGFEAYCSTCTPLLKSRSRLTLHFMPLSLRSRKEKSRVEGLNALF